MTRGCHAASSPRNVRSGRCAPCDHSGIEHVINASSPALTEVVREVDPSPHQESSSHHHARP